MIKSTCPGSPELIALGAEAALIKACYEGMASIYKIRFRKPYRDPSLDALLIKNRSETEAKILAELRLRGLNVPALYYVDVSRGLIIMEFIEGLLLRDLIRLNSESISKYLEDLGELVANIHDAGVVHGDITTSNVIVRNGEVYLIDFGLAKYSRRLENLATDLHLFIRSIESTHYGLKELLLKHFVRGYARIRGKEITESLLLKVKEIRMRGRYVEERRVRRSI